MFHQELVSDAEYEMTRARVLQDSLLCYTTGKVPLAGAVLRAAAERARSPKRTEKGNVAPRQSYTLARHCGSCIVATVKFLVTCLCSYLYLLSRVEAQTGEARGFPELG